MAPLEVKPLSCFTQNAIQTAYMPENYPCLHQVVAYTVADQTLLLILFQTQVLKSFGLPIAQLDSVMECTDNQE